MRKKYGLTRHEQALLNRARYYQNKAKYYKYKASEMHRKFSDSLQNRFYNSTTISEFEEWDLWTLDERGDCSGSEQEALFWRKVKEEEKDENER